MKRFISISARVLLLTFAIIAALRATANSSPLDEKFKGALNTVVQKVKETENPADKRKVLEAFLTRMDQGIGIARISASEKDGAALAALQLKLQADYAELSGNGMTKVPDARLNHFAGYVQQDLEQADGVYISVGCLIILLLLILIFAH